jgi:hypothetical protein
MTVEQDVTRKAVSITWDTEAVQGDTVTIRLVNPDSEGDISTKDDRNDGQSVVTYPADYAGSTDVTVTGSDGGEDTGTITV